MTEENQMYMHVQVTMLKYVTETWRFPIDKDVNPKKIFEEIKKDIKETRKYSQIQTTWHQC